MAVTGALGILVTLAAEGESRLLPMAFTFRDDAWLAAAPLDMVEHLLRCDGRPAAILFLDTDPPLVRGTLTCGVRDSERMIVRIDVPRAQRPPQPWRQAA